MYDQVPNGTIPQDVENLDTSKQGHRNLERLPIVSCALKSKASERSPRCLCPLEALICSRTSVISASQPKQTQCSFILMILTDNMTNSKRSAYYPNYTTEEESNEAVSSTKSLVTKSPWHFPSPIPCTYLGIPGTGSLCRRASHELREVCVLCYISA